MTHDCFQLCYLLLPCCAKLNARVYWHVHLSSLIGKYVFVSLNEQVTQMAHKHNLVGENFTFTVLKMLAVRGIYTV